MTAVGILHVHSTLSYDGQHTLADIACFARNCGYRFVGMSEHSDTFNTQKMARLVDECRRLSDQSLHMIPGLEFTCDNNLHLLALRIERFTEATNPVFVARFTRDQGGIAVVSHPSRYDYTIPAALAAEVHGIEVWNAAYDGRFLPNDRSIALWQNLRSCNPTLGAFGGQDLHRVTPHTHVTTTLPISDPTLRAILHELKTANFVISTPFFRVRPSAIPEGIRLNILSSLRRGYLSAKAVRDLLPH